MSANVKFCPLCAKNKKSLAPEDQADFYAGYTVCFIQERIQKECPMCGAKSLIETNITEEEMDTIGKASHYNRTLLDAMRNLKDKDIIEYELKMSQFRGNANNIKEEKKPTEYVTLNLKTGKISKTPQPQLTTPPLPTCPRCGSTSITTGARGVSGFWGFVGASKTVNRCANCGHTWTPKG